MARISYQPAGRSRGFNPEQLSTAGISRLREESNRIVEGMEKARRAEKEQRERELQALKEDAAYTERITRENQRTVIKNLENERNQEIQNIEADYQNNANTFNAINNSISALTNFSRTAAGIAERRTAKMIKDQQSIGLSADVQNISADAVETYKDAINIQAQGAIRLDTESTINGVLQNENLYETTKGYASNHGFNGIAARENDNIVAVQAFNNTLFKRLQNTEETYTSANGKTYTAIQALSDPELMVDLHNKTRKDVSSFMGFTNPLYLEKANKEITKITGAYVKSAEAAGIKQNKIEIRDGANTIASAGTAKAVGIAFQRIKTIDGNVAAHDWVEKLADNLAIPEEAVRDFDSRGDGKPYSVQQKNRWDSFTKRRETKVVQQEEFELRQKRSAYNTEINNRIPEIYQEMQVNPDATYSKLESHALSQGLIVSPAITRMYSSALKNNKANSLSLLNQLASKNILDLSFVNALDDAGLQSEGKKLFKSQQIRKYGENYSSLLSGIDTYSKKLAAFSSQTPGATSTKTEQIKIFMREWAAEDLKITQNSNVTIDKLDKLVANASDADSGTNPFSYKVVGGRRVFANIGAVNTTEIKEQKEYNTYLLNLASKKTLGEIALTPYLLADKNELEKVSTAAAAGRGFKYPYHVQTMADMYNMKPSELINEQIKAANAIDGSNIPLLTGPVVELLDNASAIQRKELQSDNPTIIGRGAIRGSDRVAQNLRPSMRPPGVKGLADLVSSGEGNPAAMFPGETYPEMLDMTIGEVVNFQKEKLRDGRSSAAVGAYQFLYPERVAQRAGLSMNDKFTPENQLKMFLGTLLNKPGRENVSRFLQGTGDNIEAAIDEMAQEFASIEYKNGRSYYNDGVNKASISRDQVRAALLAAREELITR